MSTLYELQGEFQQLLSMIQDGEYTEEELADTLEGLEGEIEIKADGYAKVIKEIEGNVSTIKAEIDRLSGKKSSLDSSIKRLKDSLEIAMRTCNKPKFKTDLFSFSIAKNGGKQSLDIYGDVPEMYCKVEVKPDNEFIRKALEDGIQLPFAILQERGELLRIK